MARKGRRTWETRMVPSRELGVEVMLEEDAREWATHNLLLGITIGGVLWIAFPLIGLLFV